MTSAQNISILQLSLTGFATRARPARRPVLLLLLILVLFSQSANLIHRHDGPLDAQFDCEFCLKIGSADDMIVAQASQQYSQAQSIAVGTTSAGPVRNAGLRPHPRGPPAA